MPDRVTHAHVERALLALPVGDVVELSGRVVHRTSEYTWTIGGSTESMLLVSVDRVMGQAGYVPDGPTLAVQRGPAASIKGKAKLAAPQPPQRCVADGGRR